MTNTFSAAKFGMEAASLVHQVASLDGMLALGQLLADKDAWSYSMRKLVELVTEFSQAAFGDEKDADQIVRDFFDEFMPSHVALNLPPQGSTSVGGLLSVYFVARKLLPSVIIESGVFVGASLHALRCAAPNAKISAFDVNLGPLKYRDETITYTESDCSESESFDGAGGLGFFDDHINNAIRVLQARNMGLKYLLFDDSPRMGEITQYRFPGVPTIPMIMDESLGTYSIGWKHGENLLRYDHDPESCKAARSHIDIAIPFPDLRPIGLYVGHKWYVRLKDPAWRDSAKPNQ